MLRTFCDFRCCNFKCVFLAFSKIRLPAETGLQSAVSPFVFKINENFFDHSKLYFHTFPLIPITLYAIFPQTSHFVATRHISFLIYNTQRFTLSLIITYSKRIGKANFSLWSTAKKGTYSLPFIFDVLLKEKIHKSMTNNEKSSLSRRKIKPGIFHITSGRALHLKMTG